MKDIKKEFKVGDRVVESYYGEGIIVELNNYRARVVSDIKPSKEENDTLWRNDISNGLWVSLFDLIHVAKPSEQTDLIRLNSRFTTNQEAIMDNQIAKHGMELQTIIITTQLVDLSLSVNATMKNYNIKNLYDLADKMAGAYIALEELKRMWQVDDETIDELIDKKMGEIKKKMEE